MSQVPSVSVCIPVYNAERYIADAVKSVLDQTYQDWETVIVDNASTDRTPVILASFKDPRIRILTNTTNIGAVPNFNRAVSLARGRYIKLLCADDLLYPQCLEKQAHVMDQDSHREIAMVCCGRDIIDQGGKHWLQRKFPGVSGRVPGSTAIGMTVRRGTNIFGEPGAVLIRAESLHASGGFDPGHNYCVDLDLWCRLLEKGDLYALQEVLCAFRVSAGSWSSSLAQKQYSEFNRFTSELVHKRGIPLAKGSLVLGRVRSIINTLLRQLFTRGIIFFQRWPK